MMKKTAIAEFFDAYGHYSDAYEDHREAAWNACTDNIEDDTARRNMRKCGSQVKIGHRVCTRPVPDQLPTIYRTLRVFTRPVAQYDATQLNNKREIEDEELEADLLVVKRPFEKEEADLRATRVEAVETREDAEKQKKAQANMEVNRVARDDKMVDQGWCKVGKEAAKEVPEDCSFGLRFLSSLDRLP
ncbi:hypothetical protein U1Q18_001662 [Sarracenia purpurea var. burkii]